MVLIVLPNMELVRQAREILSDIDLNGTQVEVKPLDDLNKIFESDTYQQDLKNLLATYSLILIDKSVLAKTKKFLT